MPDNPPRQPAKSAPVILNYQDLPPSSNIQRRIEPGHLRFIIPAAPLPKPFRRQSYRRNVLPAAFVTAILLILGVFAVRLSFPIQLDLVERLVAVAAFLVFAAALFALIWRTLALREIDLLARSRRHAVAIDANNKRLLVETTGTNANASIHLDAAEIDKIDITSGWHGRLPALQVRTRSGDSHTLLVGRDPEELRHIQKSLWWALQSGHFDKP